MANDWRHELRESFKSPFWRSLTGYLVALAATVAALYLRYGLHPFLDHRLPFITMTAAIAVAVWFGGWRPAVLVTVVGYMAADFLFIEPEAGSPLSLAGKGGIVACAVYLASSFVVIALGSALRRA